jgi:hypothetical protein
MRSSVYLPLFTLLLANLTIAEPDKVITDFGMGVELLLDRPLDEIREAKTLSIDDATEQNCKAALSRIRELPKLEYLSFYGCDLSGVNENDPVPEKVKAVLIAGGKISQGTVRWLAKYPSGVEIVFGCDVRNLEFDLGKFKWVTFDNCDISRSAVTTLVKTLTPVTFKECTLAEDK